MWQGSWIQHLFIQAYFFVKTSQFSIVMHKNNGVTNVFPETAIPKLPKTLSKVGIFQKIKLRINEKINLPQMLSLTFKSLGTARNNVSCCLVCSDLKVIQNITKNVMIFFPECLTYTCHLPLLRKLKNNFTDCCIYLT